MKNDDVIMYCILGIMAMTVLFVIVLVVSMVRYCGIESKQHIAPNHTDTIVVVKYKPYDSKD
jgi:hypothetical protein